METDKSREDDKGEIMSDEFKQPGITIGEVINGIFSTILYLCSTFASIVLLIIGLLPLAVMIWLGFLGYAISVDYVSSWFGYMILFSVFGFLEMVVFVLWMGFLIVMIGPAIETVWKRG